MTVADFMQQALQHPLYGYYTSQDSQIGQSGDFTTAPEISQLFGESIGNYF
jgi:NADH dehydrogenase [ubiquinone] 1 alpha subcomplex assembly factor 7